MLDVSVLMGGFSGRAVKGGWSSSVINELVRILFRLTCMSLDPILNKYDCENIVHI